MIDDGLFDKIPLPDIVLGQHAVPTKAGTIGTRAGACTARARTRRRPSAASTQS
jgi:metal-dependent amidase/aminoacylase/carboxypeptidase family protein